MSLRERVFHALEPGDQAGRALDEGIVALIQELGKRRRAPGQVRRCPHCGKPLEEEGQTDAAR
ncbi:MAG: hypothetical protein AB1505_16030 [Candidatus Latescibacterota bacterium]